MMELVPLVLGLAFALAGWQWVVGLLQGER